MDHGEAALVGDAPAATAARAAVGKGLDGFRRDVVPLAVHAVLGQVLGLHRLKRARTHMQRDAGACYALRFKTLQHPFVKVQRRRGGRRCARVLGKHGLVTALVLGFVCLGFVLRVGGVLVALDVGRQGHMAILLNGARHIARRVQAHDARAARRGIHDLHAKVGRNGDESPRTELAPGVNHGLGVIFVEWAQQENLRRSATLAPSKQARPEHLRGIHHHHIARRHQLGDVAKGAMRHAPVAPIDHEQSTRVTRLNGALRDPLLRELVIVVGGAAAFRGQRVGGARQYGHGRAERQQERPGNATAGGDLVIYRIRNSVSRIVFFRFTKSVTSMRSRYPPGGVAERSRERYSSSTGKIGRAHV
jgi:hypothetical protein